MHATGLNLLQPRWRVGGGFSEGWCQMEGPRGQDI